MADLAETLKDEGMEVPEGIRVQVVENTAQVFNLVIPARPTELSDKELEVVGGGFFHGRLANGFYCGISI
ncbi:NHLP leader peptide domain protein [Thiorhodovibrio winogradskyi]|uniref:NHLP leader peptide domain protein n=1 Tax=Thiorhodovibrio winogradskyi TaxID=77007 RepID=A0ABZ0SBE7_9GAMM|nr:NHLP leader peptide family RiPP precursor [Thiorhodovibrio winogradskyi]